MAKLNGGWCFIDTDRILSSICIRLGNLVNMFHELVQTAIPSGTATDALVRVLTKLYTAFTALTKHVCMFLTLVTDKIRCVLNIKVIFTVNMAYF